MIKQANIKASLKEIQSKTGASEAELQAFFNKTLAFLDRHTSCDGPRAIQVALNETLRVFKGEVW